MSDLRLALRQLVKQPSFAAAAIVTLALGIGATTTIFSVVDHLMLRELPFPEPDRIVTLWQNNTRENNPRDDVAPGNYLSWKERSAAFALMGASEPYSFDVTGDGPPERLRGWLVTDGFLEALGARPYLGRVFDARDFHENTGAVAVLGWRIWQQRFGGDPSIVDRVITLDGQPVTVIGVLQRDLDLGLHYSELPRDVWVPRAFAGWEQHARASAWWQVVARLRPGVTLSEAQADMDRVAAGLAAEFPSTNEGVGASVVALREHLVGAARTTLLLLLGAVGLLLLVACVNVANLQIARGAERARELAVRGALGAARTRLVRQLLAESAVLAAAGTAVGVALAFWSIGIIQSLAPGDIPRFDTVEVNLRVLGFAILLAGVTAVAFGLAPALRLSRPDVRDVLSSPRATTGRRGVRLREALIVAETGLALTLLVGATLLLRSFASLLAVDPGFRPDGLVALQIFYTDQAYSTQDRIQFFAESIREMEAIPGVRAAGAVSAAPFVASDVSRRGTLTLVDRPLRPGEEPQIYVSSATPGYFATLEVPLLRGRLLDETDRTDSPPVGVINETLRRRHFSDRDPIGTHVLVGNSPTPVEVVGVVADLRQRGLDIPSRPELFLSQAQNGDGSMTFFVRTTGDPASLVPALREVVWRRAPLKAFNQVATMEDLIRTTLAGRRFTLILLSVFAGLGLLLAAVGMYGVISFTVSRRTREVGIRMALGADHVAVVRAIVARGVALAAVGTAAGALLTLLLTPLMRDLLFGVQPRDVLALALSSAALLGVALVASWLPARRAARIDPGEALRAE